MKKLKYSSYAVEFIRNGKCPCGNDREDENRKTCKGCRARSKKHYKKRYEKNRELVYQHYGTSCQCCGEQHREFLAIDHTNYATREGDQRNLTEWIITNNFPEGFRILCHNCNMAVRFNRICPHKIQ